MTESAPSAIASKRARRKIADTQRALPPPVRGGGVAGIGVVADDDRRKSRERRGGVSNACRRIDGGERVEPLSSK